MIKKNIFHDRTDYYKGLEEYGCKAILEFSAGSPELESEILSILDLEVSTITKGNAKECFGDLLQNARSGMQSGVFLPLHYLQEAFQLSCFETEVLIFVLLPELDSRYGSVYSLLNGNDSMPYPTLDLLLNLTETSKEDSISKRVLLRKNSVLRQFFLLHITIPELSCLSAMFRLQERMLSFLLEEYWRNTDIQSYVQWMVPEEVPSSFLFVNNYSAQIQKHEKLPLQGEKRGRVYCLYGKRGSGKLENVLQYCYLEEKTLLLLDFTKLMNQPDPYGCFLEYIREVLLLGGKAAIFMERDAHEEVEEYLLILHRYVSCSFLLQESEERYFCRQKDWEWISLFCREPNRMESRTIWREISQSFSFESADDVELAAERFQFTPVQIFRILECARQDALWKGKVSIDSESLWSSCYSHISHQMKKRASKVTCIYTWKDLVLPKRQIDKLHTACSQMKYRYRVLGEWGFEQKFSYGQGLSMLFCGSPGTGKTMAAQVIGNELKQELYKVELAAVVSKYVGETEKNLYEIFEEAKKSQSILFFDEADVLFSKRTEVKDSNDKYSNMEAAFLLQKMEEYPGVSILATNYLQNMDDAFRRRLKFIIDFPFPDADSRYEIWKLVFPQNAPLDKGIDMHYLSENFELSGSNIKNIALYAAFLSANENSRIGMSQILRAVRNELEKNGRTITKEDLGEYQMYFSE